MSSIIVALDRVDNVYTAVEIVDSLCGEAAGFKIGLPLVLSHGTGLLRRLRSLCSKRLWIADFKLADIGAIMVQTVDTVIQYVDAFIAHSFVGLHGALDELKKHLDSNDKKLILVASMSHPGSTEFYDTVLDRVDALIDNLRPWGVVAPATRPEIVKHMRQRHPWVVILSPGVGAQGAPPGTALCSGAQYEIIGRAITLSEDPLEALRRIAREQEEAVHRCRAVEGTRRR